MKLRSSNENDPPLSGLLKEWKVKSSLPPRFQERVWQRIALAETAAPGNRFAQALARLQSVIVRPRLAAGYVTALLLLGFVMGWSQGLEKSARVDQALSSRYVRVIDPYQGMQH